MSEWSDDDGAPVAPPQSTKVPPRNTRAEVQSKRGEEVPKQQVRGAPERRAEERSTTEIAGPPPQDIGVDPKAMAGGSGRHRRFKKLYWQTKP